MSGPRFSIFAAKAVFDQRLTATDLRVLAALGTHSNNEGWLRASQGKIATKVGVSRTTVVASVRKLCDTGYLESRQRFAEHKGQVSNLYRVKIDPPEELAVDCDIELTPVSPDDTPCQPTEHPLSSQDDTIERSPKNEVVAAPARATPVVSKAMIEEAQARAGPAANLANGDMHHGGVLRSFLAKGCEWPDVLDAIDAVSGPLRAKGRQFGSWKYIQAAAFDRRDQRLGILTGGENGRIDSRPRPRPRSAVEAILSDLGRQP